MKRPTPLIFRLLAAALGALALAASAPADNHVAVIGMAEPEYTRQKFEGTQPKTETYVMMQGKYFDGITADRSIEQLTFRRIANYLAPELARQKYMPASGPASADLLLIVHWGTTVPRFSNDEMRGVMTIDTAHKEGNGIGQIAAESLATGTEVGAAAFLNTDNLTFGGETARQSRLEELDRATDLLDLDLQVGNTSQLLGYTKELRRLRATVISSEAENTLRSDLLGERYFIIIKAYSLHDKIVAGVRPKPVWTLHLNVRSPGNNFTTALNKMGTVAVDFFGRSTDGVQTARPSLRTGTVTLGPLIILGDAADKARKADPAKPKG